MKNIWRDPVWSKVIAWLILGLISFTFTAIYQYFIAENEGGGFFKVLFNSNIEINSFVLISIVVFLLSVLLISFLNSYYKKYDIFLSAPMSSNTEEEYKEIRKTCLKLIEHLKEYTPYKKIYFAAENIKTTNNFNPGNIAVLDDLKALRKSKRLFLYMPMKVPTSAIFEAGYAFRKNLPTVYFCHKNEDLPFLMRDLNGCFKSVNKYESSSIDNLKNHIKTQGKRLFNKSM